MKNRKPEPSPSIMGLNLSKEDWRSNVNMTLYKIIVGSLINLAATRLDIMYAVSFLSKFMETPKETHWQAVKRILKC